MSQELMNAWAVELADECMFAQILTESSMSSETDGVLGFTDESCAEVRTLAEASEGMKQAFAWLSLRGFVRLAADAHGEHIVVISKPKRARSSATAEEVAG
jgi:hypothetical protein